MTWLSSCPRSASVVFMSPSYDIITHNWEQPRRGILDGQRLMTLHEGAAGHQVGRPALVTASRRRSVAAARRHRGDHPRRQTAPLFPAHRSCRHRTRRRPHRRRRSGSKNVVSQMNSVSQRMAPLTSSGCASATRWINNHVPYEVARRRPASRRPVRPAVDLACSNRWRHPPGRDERHRRHQPAHHHHPRMRPPLKLPDEAGEPVSGTPTPSAR